jgi:hypothetical protein
MTEKTIQLDYEGYWREPNIRGIPARSGLYCVYRCQHNKHNTVTIHALVYIGESSNVHDRIQGHEKWPYWKRYLQSGEQVCFSFAPINAGREQAEAALINHHRPPENTEFVGSFPFQQATIYTSGRSALLSPAITAYPTAGLWAYGTNR